MPHPIRVAIQEGRLCRNLRTKAMFVFGEDGPPATLEHIPDTAAFWCNCSGYALGPDRVPVNAERCADRARECFEGEVSA